MGGGDEKCRNNETPVFGVQNHESFGFSFDFEAQKCFRVPTPWGLYGAEWDERLRSSCTFQPFCYVDSFGDLGDPMLPPLRGVSGDVVTIYA